MSPVTTDMRRPSSVRKVSASAHMGPKDSIAIGTNIRLMASSLYFANLRADDCSATNPAETDKIAACARRCHSISNRNVPKKTFAC